MRAFLFGVFVAIGFDWLFLVPAYLFGTCSWSTGCSFEQQVSGFEWHAMDARKHVMEHASK